MNDKDGILKSITGFIKSRLKTVEAQPEIKMDFSPSFTTQEYKQALRETWEEILKRLDENPETVLSREWSNLEWSWQRYEEIMIKEDNIVVELSGAKYPMPGARQVKPEVNMTQMEYSDQRITQNLPSFLNDLTNASPEKKRAVYISVSAAVRGEVTDDELVRKVADDVIQRLLLRKLMKGEEG